MQVTQQTKKLKDSSKSLGWQFNDTVNRHDIAKENQLITGVLSFDILPLLNHGYVENQEALVFLASSPKSLCDGLSKYCSKGYGIGFPVSVRSRRKEGLVLYCDYYSTALFRKKLRLLENHGFCCIIGQKSDFACTSDGSPNTAFVNDSVRLESMALTIKDLVKKNRLKPKVSKFGRGRILEERDMNVILPEFD